MDDELMHKKERPQLQDGIILGNVSGHPGLDHQWRIKQVEAPPTVLDHLGRSRGLKPRTRSSDAEQKGSATIPRTGSSGETWPDAPDWIIRGGTSRRSRQPPD